MKNQKEQSERRRFLKRAVGMGAMVWLTPAIISVSANRAHAQLSGGGQEQPDYSTNVWPRDRRTSPRLRTKP
jgi:hypothetical protein